MDVADDVERAGHVLLVVPKRLPRDRRGLHILRARKDRDVAKALAFERPKSLAKEPDLLRDDVLAEVAVGALAVAFFAQRFGHVEHDGARNHVVLARQ